MINVTAVNLQPQKSNELSALEMAISKVEVSIDRYPRLEGEGCSTDVITLPFARPQARDLSRLRLLLDWASEHEAADTLEAEPRHRLRTD